MTDDAHAMLVRAMTSPCLVCGFCVDSVSCDCLCGEAPSCRVLCGVFYLLWCYLWPLVSTYAERSDEPAFTFGFSGAQIFEKMGGHKRAQSLGLFKRLHRRTQATSADALCDENDALARCTGWAGMGGQQHASRRSERSDLSGQPGGSPRRPPFCAAAGDYIVHNK